MVFVKMTSSMWASRTPPHVASSWTAGGARGRALVDQHDGLGHQFWNSARALAMPNGITCH